MVDEESRAAWLKAEWYSPVTIEERCGDARNRDFVPSSREEVDTLQIRLGDLMEEERAAREREQKPYLSPVN